jgi:hypothetical protein
MKPITNPNTSETSQEYWEEVLKSHGLSMSSGSVPSRKVSFIGGLNNLVGKEEEEYRRESGQVVPSGKGPDK